MSGRSCGTCSGNFLNDDFISCDGICEKSFHGTLKCCGLRNDAAKLVMKNESLRYVCGDCQQAKMFHVLESIRLCNNNVLSMRGKLDEISDTTSAFMRRLSSLEHSVNDVTDYGDLSTRADFDVAAKMNEIQSQVSARIELCETRMRANMEALVDKNVISLKARNQADEDTLTRLHSSNDKLLRDVEQIEVRLKTFVSSLVRDSFSTHLTSVESSLRESSAVLISRIDEKVDSLVTIASSMEKTTGVGSIHAELDETVPDGRADTNGAIQLEDSIAMDSLREILSRPQYQLCFASPVTEGMEDESFITVDESYSDDVSETSLLDDDEEIVSLDDNERIVSTTKRPRNRRSQSARLAANRQGNRSHRDETPTPNIQQRLLNIAAESNQGYAQMHRTMTKTRWIRVAGLNCTVTAQQIRDHVFDTTGCRDVRCLPLYGKNVDPRSLSYVNFRIGVPNSFFSAVLDGNNWPGDVSTREFIENGNFRTERRNYTPRIARYRN